MDGCPQTISGKMEDMNLVPDEDGGNLYLINGNMTKLKDAGLFAGKNPAE